MERELGKSANWVRKFARRTGSNDEKDWVLRLIVKVFGNQDYWEGEGKEGGFFLPFFFFFFFKLVVFEFDKLFWASVNRIDPNTGEIKIIKFELFYQEENPTVYLKHR